jgi:hypothetical protein
MRLVIQLRCLLVARGGAWFTLAELTVAGRPCLERPRARSFRLSRSAPGVKRLCRPAAGVITFMRRVRVARSSTSPLAMVDHQLGELSGVAGTFDAVRHGTCPIGAREPLFLPNWPFPEMRKRQMTARLAVSSQRNKFPISTDLGEVHDA